MMFNSTKCADGRKVKGAYTAEQVKAFAKKAGVKLSVKGKAKSKTALCKEVASMGPVESKAPYGVGAFPEKLRATVAAKMRTSGRPASHYSKSSGKLLKKFQYVYKTKPSMR